MGLNMFFRTTTIDLLPSSDLLSPHGFSQDNNAWTSWTSCSWDGQLQWHCVFPSLLEIRDIQYVIATSGWLVPTCVWWLFIVEKASTRPSEPAWTAEEMVKLGQSQNFLRRHKSRLGVPKSLDICSKYTSIQYLIGSELHKGENWWKPCIPEHLINTIVQLFRWYFREMILP